MAKFPKKIPPHRLRSQITGEPFVSKRALSMAARGYARHRGSVEATIAEETGHAPRVYRKVSEANPNLSHNEVRRISREANIRTAQGFGKNFDMKPDLVRKAARKALKMGYKANEALKGGAGVTKETVGALRRSVIAMGKFGAKVAKGAAAGMPGELVTEGEKMVNEGMKKTKARMAENAAKRRKRVATVRSTG